MLDNVEYFSNQQYNDENVDSKSNFYDKFKNDNIKVTLIDTFYEIVIK
jgi:hypothetical protein